MSSTLWNTYREYFKCFQLFRTLTTLLAGWDVLRHQLKIFRSRFPIWTSVQEPRFGLHPASRSPLPAGACQVEWVCSIQYTVTHEIYNKHIHCSHQKYALCDGIRSSDGNDSHRPLFFSRVYHQVRFLSTHSGHKKSAALSQTDLSGNAFLRRIQFT